MKLDEVIQHMFMEENVGQGDDALDVESNRSDAIKHHLRHGDMTRSGGGRLYCMLSRCALHWGKP